MTPGDTSSEKLGSKDPDPDEPLLNKPKSGSDNKMNDTQDSECSSTSGSGNAIKLQKQIGLFSGVSVIVGSIIGSGIFVSPKGVLEQTGSVGLSLIVWLLCGAFSMVGAHCFSELGTMIPSSGADYSYLMEAFGPLLAFLRLWVECIVVRPCTTAIVAMTFSNYILEPIYPSCDPPDAAISLLAAICITVLTAVNAYDVKWATRVQDVFTLAKLLALVLIIITGIVQLARGRVEYFQQPFQGSNWTLGNIALAFYQGLFAYNGWNYLNYVIEELKDPYRNLPKAIWMSVTIVTTVYVSTNVAYFTTVSPEEVLTSPAVAVTFSVYLYGFMWWIMPVFVALSTFGGVNGILFTTARLFFVGSREGHMPEVLSMVQLKKMTPAPAVIFMGFSSLIYLFSTNMYRLINYVAFVNWLAIGLSVVALLYFRYTRPLMDRPIRVWLGWPIFYVAFSVFLVVVPLYASPVETGFGCLIIATGIPVYIIFVKWKRKPKSVNSMIGKVTNMIQKILMVVPEEQNASKSL